MQPSSVLPWFFWAFWPSHIVLPYCFPSFDTPKVTQMDSKVSIRIRRPQAGQANEEDQIDACLKMAAEAGLSSLAVGYIYI
jgi:hypothetical protein